MSLASETAASSSGAADDSHRESDQRRPAIIRQRFSRPGLVVAGLFFAASLLPSLLPRQGWVQGIVTGITVAIGYGIGTTLAAFWRYLQVPSPKGRVRAFLIVPAIALVAWAVLLQAWRFIGLQDEQRALLGMPPLSFAAWPTMVMVAILVFALLLVVARLVRRFSSWVIAALRRVLPDRLAIVLGVFIVTIIASMIYSNLLVRGFFATANAVFAPRNDTNKTGVVDPPTSPLRSGGPESTVSWDSLGREGRSFVTTGPTVSDIKALTSGTKVEQPIRVYAGLESAPTTQERADIVLAELKRTNAFDRDLLVLATTTGSGFVEPEGIDPVEYLWRGDTAVAAMQYSYLPSWLSLLADQENAQLASQDMFETVYAYWRTLPESSRPKLYLYGLSLGSFGAQSVLGSFQLLNEPIDGALLSGPPFVNPLHARLTAERDEGTPAWRPIYQEGRTARFTVQEPTLESLPGQSAEWGPMRVAYLQHGSDPVVFFSPRLFVTSPPWLEGERAPDVSPAVSWFPLVTGWQTLFDLASAGSVPWGYGHLYGPGENTTSWSAVTQPPGWSPEQIAELATTLDDKQVG